MMEQTKSRINLHDFSGKQESNSDLVHRICDLPDSILGVILSFLPTKEAVATVVLSKRWKFMWRRVQNLDFCQEVRDKDKDMKFIEFVNRVLHLHDAGLLKKFSLYWNYHPMSSSHTSSWISTAIKKNVHNLSLCGAGDVHKLFCVGPYDLPTSVFSCDSLRSLMLTRIYTSVSDTLVVCLPRLESLKFDQVNFESEEACEKLISGCPMLNDLHLNIGNDDFKCIISSASLRRLKISFSRKSSLKLKASSLENLRLDGGILEIFVEKSLSSVVEAHLDIMLDHDDFSDDGFLYNSIVEAIRAFDCAKILALSTDVIQALECATISLSTEFKRLVKLVAITCRSLQDFIRNSDNLEVLIIHQDLFESSDHHSKWTALVEVPRCLSNNLKKVQLYYYTCSKDECEMIQFMLEHGSALEVVEIFCDGDIKRGDFDSLQERFKLTQKILAFPRKSPVCEVHISHW